ncbi:unnamed protein product [Mesocestoides corti]|uniref:Selenoprotein W n=1 Tax=Mesocestoides corti TaxID=53468 RepID=A0A0R3UFS3_MESCO|nr:unnamed protein product [Mesocestoides corti]
MNPNRFKDALVQRFGDRIEVVCCKLLNFMSQTGKGTPTSTGWFEVEISGLGLVFSKKNGDGFVDTQEKLDRISDAIEKVL